jgi:putative transposase
MQDYLKPQQRPTNRSGLLQKQSRRLAYLPSEHVSQLVSVDFFTVPTIRFQVLYVFLVLAHDRRRIVHFNVTAHPTAEWTSQQLRNAFPFEHFSRYLPRDRDATGRSSRN